jgi:hypothetical protein
MRDRMNRVRTCPMCHATEPTVPAPNGQVYKVWDHPAADARCPACRRQVLAETVHRSPLAYGSAYRRESQRRAEEFWS